MKQGNVPTANCPPLPYPFAATAGGRGPTFNARYGGSSGGRPPPFSRGHVKHIKVKGKKGKKGKIKETYELIVNIDLVNS